MKEGRMFWEMETVVKYLMISEEFSERELKRLERKFVDGIREIVGREIDVSFEREKKLMSVCVKDSGDLSVVQNVVGRMRGLKLHDVKVSKDGICVHYFFVGGISFGKGGRV